MKDLISGDPSGPTYGEAYKNAVAEGLNHDEAHRQALLAGAVRDTAVSERKERDREEDRERERRGQKTSSGLVDLRWD